MSALVLLATFVAAGVEWLEALTGGVATRLAPLRGVLVALAAGLSGSLRRLRREALDAPVWPLPGGEEAGPHPGPGRPGLGKAGAG